MHLKHFAGQCLLGSLTILTCFVWAGADLDKPVLFLQGSDKALDATDNADKAVMESSDWLGATVSGDGLSVNVYFKDPAGQGFRDATLGKDRRDRLYEALKYLCDVLNESGEVDLVVDVSETDGMGPLAEGGPLFRSVNGLTNGNAYERIVSGAKPYAGYSEMDLGFDWGHPWHTGNGPAPYDKVDLRSVALHELTHCFGFVSLMASTGASQIPGAPHAYTYLDSLLAKANQVNLVTGGAANPTFTASATDLVSGALIFKGAAARAAFGDTCPPIESASPFRAGTSLQHWMSGGIPAGAVMEPSYMTGVLKREYSAVDIAALQDLGYTDAEGAESATDCPLASITFTQPGATIAATGAATPVTAKTSVTFDYSDDDCLIEDDDVTVAYYVDGALRTSSSAMSQQFPGSLSLTAGAHTLRAVATRTGVGSPVETQINVNVQAAIIPLLEVTPGTSPVAFGEVVEGAAKEITFIVKNSGNGTLTGVGSLTGDPAFALVGVASYSLGAEEQASVVVRLTPPAKNASFQGVLTFTGNNGQEVQLALTGTSIGSGGLFNCAGRPQGVSWRGLFAGDLLVAALALLILMAGRHCMARRETI